MPTRDEVKEKLIDIVVDQLQVNRDQVEEATSFVDDLGADSLDIAELTMEIEDTFDINIPDDEEGIKTVADSIDYIMKHSS